MELSVDLTFGMNIIHKTGSEINLNKSISRTWKEDSEEFQELVKAYTEETGMERKETNKNKFDEEMLRYAAERLEEDERETRNRIITTYKTFCMGQATHGYIEYSGYVINLCDISGIQIPETKLRIRKG